MFVMAAWPMYVNAVIGKNVKNVVKIDRQGSETIQIKSHLTKL
jgi:hypothetical protein